MITILCSGSRGDYQPYISLAQEIMKNEKSVRIVGIKEYENFIKDYGIDFYSLEADYKSLNVNPEIIKQAQKADNTLKMLLSFNKMKKYGVELADKLYNACEGSKLIIYHPGMTIGYFAAQKLGIPSVLASPFPLHKTKERVSVVRYGRSKASDISISMSYKLLQEMLWMASKNIVKKFWKERYGKLPENFSCPYEKVDENNPAIISCSNYVFSKPNDWNKNVHQYGYWFVDESESYIPSKGLNDFLQKDEKPIYIGFGSAFNKEQKESILKKIIMALNITSKRAIISGMGHFNNLPENIITVDNIPHSWLFNKVSAVCHHGGAGTTAAGFRAGVPSIIIPFSNDQFAWAYRAYELGVGSVPIPYKNLTSQNLAQAIRSIYNEKIINKSKRLSEQIKSENGVKDAVNKVTELLK